MHWKTTREQSRMEEGQKLICALRMTLMDQQKMNKNLPNKWNGWAHICPEKTKLMTNNTDCIDTDIRVCGKELEAVNSFKYLGSAVLDEGSRPEILSRVAQTTAVMTKLRPIWNDKNIMLSSKIRPMRSLVIAIFLYACELWTFMAKLERRIQITVMKCFSRLLGISHKDRITNAEVWNKITKAIGPHEDLLTTVKKRRLSDMGMSQGHQDLPKQSCLAQCKERERQEVKERDWRITSPNAHERSWVTTWGCRMTYREVLRWFRHSDAPTVA